MKLIVKINNYWGIFEIDNNLIILPLKTPKCSMRWGDEVCNGDLILHDFRCYKHSIHPPHIHCDVHLKCVKCGWFYTFGLSIPEELLDKLTKSRYHGKTLRWELLSLSNVIDKNDLEIIEKRLRSWGYW